MSEHRTVSFWGVEPDYVSIINLVHYTRFSRRAQTDLEAINRHTIEIWGQKQAIAYLDGLALTAKKLAAAPKIGKARDVMILRGDCAPSLIKAISCTFWKRKKAL